MPKMIFINLPVTDLAAATRFYEAIVEAAVSAGGKGDIRDRQDHGFMYGRTFEDPDGNIFEPVWMDPAGMAAEPAAQGG